MTGAFWLNEGLGAAMDQILPKTNQARVGRMIVGSSSASSMC
jgi:hypothetical protein